MAARSSSSASSSPADFVAATSALSTELLSSWRAILGYLERPELVAHELGPLADRLRWLRNGIGAIGRELDALAGARNGAA